MRSAYGADVARARAVTGVRRYQHCALSGAFNVGTHSLFVVVYQFTVGRGLILRKVVGDIVEIGLLTYKYMSNSL